MRGVFIVPIDAVAVTAVQDLWSFLPATDKPIELLGAVLNQSSDAGDAQDEQLRVRIRRGFTSAGSGGSSVTAGLLDALDSAAATTCRINDTTQASGGTIVTLLADAFNVRAGWVYRPLPEERIRCQPGVRLVIDLPAAPADSLTLSGYALIKEL